MGQGQSNVRIYHKVLHVMPPVNKSGSDSGLSGWFDKSTKPFASDKDRDQFIYATITVLSQNGTLDLKDHDIRLLYSRRDNDRIVARIVSEREGVIKAQVEPSRDGKDQAEAFLALRRHVEIKLDYILKDVPGASDRFRDDDDDGSNTVAGPSRSAHTPATSPPMSPSREIARRPLQLETQNQGRNITSPIEAPPAYGKAVKEWRTDEKSG